MFIRNYTLYKLYIALYDYLLRKYEYKIARKYNSA